MFSLLGGVFLGWSLGANDASNVFGSAVASRMLKFWTAAILAAVFVLLGAILQGQAGILIVADQAEFFWGGLWAQMMRPMYLVRLWPPKCSNSGQPLF